MFELEREKLTIDCLRTELCTLYAHSKPRFAYQEVSYVSTSARGGKRNGRRNKSLVKKRAGTLVVTAGMLRAIGKMLHLQNRVRRSSVKYAGRKGTSGSSPPVKSGAFAARQVTTMTPVRNSWRRTPVLRSPIAPECCSVTI